MLPDGPNTSETQMVMKVFFFAVNPAQIVFCLVHLRLDGFVSAKTGFRAIHSHFSSQSDLRVHYLDHEINV